VALIDDAVPSRTKKMQTAIEYLRDVNIIWSEKAGRDRFSTYPALRANYTYTIKEQWLLPA